MDFTVVCLSLTTFLFYLLNGAVHVCANVAPRSHEILFHSHLTCGKGEFPCAASGKCLAQRYWCDEIKDCPKGDDEDERYCGEKTSGFGRHFVRRIVDLGEKDGCMAPEPLLPSGTMFHDHVGKDGIKCFVGRYPKRCVCMVNRIRCDELSLTQIFAFTNETADPETPMYSFLHNRIQYIQEDVFRLFPNMRHLDFRQNSISGLNKGAFNGLSNLRRLHLDQNKLSRIDPRVFWPLEKLCFLWLGQNGIQSWEPHSFNNSRLRWLDLKSNRITLEAGMFSLLNSLFYLELEVNEIRSLSKEKLAGLNSLLYLDVSCNLIEKVEENTFEATPHLEELSLANNSLTSLPENVFSPLSNLQFLNLSHNPGIKSLPMDIFKGLIRLDRLYELTSLKNLKLSLTNNLTDLNLSGVLISNIHREMFDDIPNNALVIFSKFHYCYYAAHIVDCYPKSDGISSSENMIELAHIRTLVWVLIALIPMSNLFVLLARCCIRANEPVFSAHVSQRFFRHDLDVMSKLRYNLFLSNSLMTVYLLIIAIYDIQFRENYHREAYKWLHGVACHTAGMMATLSIFISLVTLCVVLIDRYLCITQPPSRHLSSRGCVILIISLWLSGILILGIPVAIWDNVTGSFYGNNGLCLPLYLDEPYLNGWWYSCVLFFGVFLLCVSITVFCLIQTRRYAALHKGEDPLEETNAHANVATRYLVIIIVNLICWLPVIVVKILALTSFDIGNHIHSIFAILILPLNSCLTPLLHVYLSLQFRRKFAKVVSLSLSGQTQCCHRQREDSELKSVDGFYHNNSNILSPPLRLGPHGSRNHSPVTRPLLVGGRRAGSISARGAAEVRPRSF